MKEEVLKVSKKIILEEGVSALNLNNIVDEMMIPVEVVLSYFPTKDDLLFETIYAIFDEIMMPVFNYEGNSLIEFVSVLYDAFLLGNEKYHDFLLYHSIYFLGFKHEKASQAMNKTLTSLKGRLVNLMISDKSLNKKAFNKISFDTLASYILRFLVENINSRGSKEEFMTLLVNYYA